MPAPVMPPPTTSTRGGASTSAARRAARGAGPAPRAPCMASKRPERGIHCEPRPGIRWGAARARPRAADARRGRRGGKACNETMEHPSAALLVRAYFAAYEAHDRSALAELLADGFRFTSPLDEGLDRDAYFERCWPFNAQVRAFDLERVFAQGGEAFVQYLCVRTSGETFTNVELFRTAEGKILEVQVFFGSAPGTGEA